MASLLSSIGQAVYREYDRRVRRASLVTEYGAAHHGHAAHHDAEDAGEIANLPRGADVREHADAPVAHIAAPNEDLSLPEASPTPAAPAASAPAVDDGEDGAIVNAPPGTPLQP